MYEQIARNRRNSILLVCVFIVLIGALSWTAGVYTGAGYYALIFALVFSFIMALSSYYGGDKIILKISRAKRIQKKDNPQLFNVVEEMAIAGGLPLPKIYIIDDTAPNAFATGRNPAGASIAVTTGILSKLNREELQGVIGHELSHIRHFDILFCTIIAVLVGIVALLCDFMRRSFFYGGMRRGRSRSNSRGGSGGGIIILIAVLLAVFAPLFAQIIRFAVSRQREYLADAGSVELTRNPAGLARALEKISKDKEVLEAANRATQHLYIINPIKAFEKRARNSVFDTHPPVRDRIKRLMDM